MARAYKNPPIEVETLDELYIFRKREEVTSFLRKYSYLIPVLPGIYGKLKSYFPDAKLSLEVSTDPEAPKHSHLVIWITTDLSPEEALDKLHQSDEDLWHNMPRRVTEKLSTSLI